MNLTSLIEIIIAIVVVYFFIRFIVSPVLKAIIGIIIFLVLIYILQRFFGFNLGQVLAPFGISFDSNNWGSGLNWLLGPINYYVDQIKIFLSFIWGNFPKSASFNKLQ